MKKLFFARAIYLSAVVVVWLLTACSIPSAPADFIRVEDGRLLCGEANYRFVGTNFWYGVLLASEGQGGDRERLAAELDNLHARGLDNLRVLVGAEGSTPKRSLVWPTLQTAPGVYNDTILAGLDWLLKEMGDRGMKAVLYLNNSWEWSGGYGQYLEWAGQGSAPDPTDDGYRMYCDYVAHFSTNAAAQQLYQEHVCHIVGRTNRYTGRPYADDPAIMAWQLGNEPRAFAVDSLTKEGFVHWLTATAALIKELDPHHLVSVGSEGYVGCEMDAVLYERIHEDPHIDYLTIHIWPMNWGWITRDEMRADTLDTDTAVMARVCRFSRDYLETHLQMAERLRKPLVIEEFGYARDGLSFDLTSSTRARDTYYKFILGWMQDPAYSEWLAGINFWAWSGLAQPRHIRWQPYDDYCGDPAQEEQGLFSVFASDSSTLQILTFR